VRAPLDLHSLLPVREQRRMVSPAVSPYMKRSIEVARNGENDSTSLRGG